MIWYGYEVKESGFANLPYAAQFSWGTVYGTRHTLRKFLSEFGDWTPFWIERLYTDRQEARTYGFPKVVIFFKERRNEAD